MELLDKSECTFKLFDGGKDIIRGGAHGNCAKLHGRYYVGVYYSLCE